MDAEYQIDIREQRAVSVNAPNTQSEIDLCKSCVYVWVNVSGKNTVQTHTHIVRLARMAMQLNLIWKQAIRKQINLTKPFVYTDSHTKKKSYGEMTMI